MPRRLLFDLEGNGLLPELTTIHCIAAVDLDTRQRLSWRPHQLSEAYESMSTADVLVAHYGLGYDFPAMEKIAGFVVPEEKRRDSVVMAKLIVPNLRDTDGALVQAGTLDKELHGKHKLKAWGQRIGIHKGDYEGPWDTWSETMHAYMEQDVETLLGLWEYLKPDSYSQQAIELEHRIQLICMRMETAGWPFDIPGAQRLHVRLAARHAELEQQLVAEFGSWYQPKKKDKFGNAIPFVPKRDNARLGYVAEAPCTQIEKVTFNPSSRQHIIRSLSLLGWKPEAFLDSGQPKLDDEVLATLSSTIPSTSKIVEYLLLDKRIGQIATGDKAWLTQVGPDGNMHGTTDPMGTSSSRAAHYRPNLGQVPATKSPYGRECRELFGVPEGWTLVGADQSSLQLRCLGHYLQPFDGGAYGQAVAQGDPHWRAVQALGLSSEERDEHSKLHEVLREKGGKTFGYATIFGCFDKKAGSIVRDCLQTGIAKQVGGAQELYDQFFGQGQSNNAVGGRVRARYYEQLGLGRLLERLKALRQRTSITLPDETIYRIPVKGALPGLDGRYVPTRSDHASLAFLLQSAEAVLCKRWVCDTYDALIARGFKWGWDGDFVFCGWVHDELQVAVRNGLEHEIGKIIAECAENAGKPYGFRVPLASKYKTGRTWADTH